MNIIKFVQILFIIQITFCINKAYCQNEEFIMFPDSEIVEMRMDFSANGFAIIISNFPDEIRGYGLAISNLKGTCSGGCIIDQAQFFLETRGKRSSADTFVVYLFSYSRDLKYPAEIFTISSLKNSLKLGANCYNLNCVPKNDPWMPTSYDPFLFPKNGFYINPKNGKIKKGSRLINSGNYNICDLKNWRYISPYGLYIDLNGNKFKGVDLIKRGKIELTEWNIKVFDLYWFL